MKQKYKEGYMDYIKKMGVSKKKLKISEQMEIGEYKINYDTDPVELMYKDEKDTTSVPFEWTDANLLKALEEDIQEIFEYFTSGKLDKEKTPTYLDILYSLPRVIKLQLAKKDLFINPGSKDAIKKHEQYLREGR
jgi:hypothetical protein